MQAGLHLLIVRILLKINLPQDLGCPSAAPEYEGCKSWIDVPVDLSPRTSRRTW